MEKSASLAINIRQPGKKLDVQKGKISAASSLWITLGLQLARGSELFKDAPAPAPSPRSVRVRGDGGGLAFS